MLSHDEFNDTGAKNIADFYRYLNVAQVEPINAHIGHKNEKQEKPGRQAIGKAQPKNENNYRSIFPAIPFRSPRPP